MKTKRISQKDIYTGTSGLVLPVPNKSHYPAEYREGSRLHYYGSLFNSIEINSTFYKIPQAKTLQRWAAEVPEHFRFTVKLWKGITHNKELQFSTSDLRHFMGIIEAIGDKKGCLLIQFPGKIGLDQFTQLEKMLKCIYRLNKNSGWRLQIEFRNPSLYCGEVFFLLKELNIGVVIHDMVNSPTPMDIMPGQVAYLRLHGPEKGYRGDYSQAILKTYATQVSAWADQEKEVFVYFNNTLGNAVNNLITLNKYLHIS